jgi:hypothetical protein
MHSEYYNGNKKAVVSKKVSTNIDENRSMWEVSMFIDDRVIQKTNAYSEQQAENIAEDFINAGSRTSPTLLNESLNG